MTLLPHCTYCCCMTLSDHHTHAVILAAQTCHGYCTSRKVCFGFELHSPTDACLQVMIWSQVAAPLTSGAPPRPVALYHLLTQLYQCRVLQPVETNTSSATNTAQAHLMVCASQPIYLHTYKCGKTRAQWRACWQACVARHMISQKTISTHHQLSLQCLLLHMADFVCMHGNAPAIPSSLAHCKFVVCSHIRISR